MKLHRTFSFQTCSHLLLLIGSTLLASSDLKAQSTETVKTDCLLLMLDQASIAAKRDGVIEQLEVRLGDEIEKGSVLFVLGKDEATARYEVASASHERAKAKASNVWQVRVAESELKKASEEDSLLRKSGRTPYLEQFRAANAKERSAAAVRSAETEYLENQLDERVKLAEKRVAQLDIADREVLAPFTGTVIKEYKYESEWVSKGEPVLKILRMDELMLQGIVNIRDLPPHRIPGAKLRAEFNFAGEPTYVIEGLSVLKAAPEVDLDGNYVIWTHIQNSRRQDLQGQPQWLLRPGIHGTLYVELPPQAETQDIVRHDLSSPPANRIVRAPSSNSSSDLQKRK